MHLYALNSNGKIISVHQASKQQNYCCLECKGPVRRRAGSQRTPHFFHLKPSSHCRQQAKSMAHLQTQCYLHSILPPKDCQLEYPFPSIKRIADVVWFSKKIIFEVQCSPIHPDEIKSRNADYASQGYQVIWVLHDQRYNQWKLSAAENYLSLHPHYYTNIDAEGSGFIYDQGYLLRNGVRKERMQILRIDPTQPLTIELFPPKMPKILRSRISHWPLYFSGDLLHQGMNHPENFRADFENENSGISWKLGIKQLMKVILHPYELVFRMLLEKVCK
jgi:competence protein CoiA